MSFTYREGILDLLEKQKGSTFIFLALRTNEIGSQQFFATFSYEQSCAKDHAVQLYDSLFDPIQLLKILVIKYFYEKLLKA